MPVSDPEIAILGATYDIISLGVRADEVRRQRHGTRTTFVRVANVPADPKGPLSWPPKPGEIRIVGARPDRAGAIDRVRQVVQQAGSVPVSAFSLADLEGLAAREGVTLRALLEELRAEGLELIAEAPLDRLHDARRSI